MNLSKAEMFEEIRRVSETQGNIAKDMYVKTYTEYGDGMLARTIIAMCAGISDSLNNLSLILCKMLPDGGADDAAD